MSAVGAVLVPALLYAWGLVRVGRRPGWTSAAWAGGLLVLVVATAPWMDRAADGRLSMHMVQHELIGLVAAPLLVAGAPVRLAFAASSRGGRHRLAALLRRPILRSLTHPAVGVGVYASVLAAVHLPAVYDLALRSGVVHGAVHAALLWSALLLWLPLIGADPLPHRPSATATVSALIAAMGAMGVLGAILAAEQHVVYAPYATRTTDALADQHLAGGLMSVGGMVVVLPALLALAWRALIAEERRATVREARGLSAGGPR
jgi:cytochrome c oxidase assembly factor CtaG